MQILPINPKKNHLYDLDIFSLQYTVHAIYLFINCNFGTQPLASKLKYSSYALTLN